MQSDRPEDVSPPGMSDHFPADQESADPVIDRLLSERARTHRAPAELAGRIVRATSPLIAPPTYSMRSRVGQDSAGRSEVAAARLRRFAIAASLAFLAGAVMVAVLSSRTVKDVTSGSPLVAAAPDPSAGLTDSEPVLVSLLAGSDVDPAGADQHPAEAVLRVRDASFAELQSEVLLVVSAGVGTR